MASRLAYIDVPDTCGPFELLQTWIDDFKKQTAANYVVFNLATSSNKGDVKNRNVVLQELAENGVIFNTISNSPKARQIAENPKVAACFMFQYAKDYLQGISRQIRIEGVIEKMPQDVIEGFYNSQPLHAKIRTHLIKDQGVEVQWDDLKRKHDELMALVTKGEVELKMPEHYVSYKIIPKLFDFYNATGPEIADRLFFQECASGSWSRCHITA